MAISVDVAEADHGRAEAVALLVRVLHHALDVGDCGSRATAQDDEPAGHSRHDRIADHRVRCASHDIGHAIAIEVAGRVDARQHLARAPPVDRPESRAVLAAERDDLACALQPVVTLMVVNALCSTPGGIETVISG